MSSTDVVSENTLFLIETEKKSTDALFAYIIFFFQTQNLTETIKWAKGNAVFVESIPLPQSTIFIILFVLKSFILIVLFFKTMFFD